MVTQNPRRFSSSRAARPRFAKRFLPTVVPQPNPSSPPETPGAPRNLTRSAALIPQTKEPFVLQHCFVLAPTHLLGFTVDLPVLRIALLTHEGQMVWYAANSRFANQK